MIEHRDAVGREPDVALDSCRTQPQAQPEGLEGVGGCVGAGPAVREGDRRVEHRRQLAHASGLYEAGTSMPAASSAGTSMVTSAVSTSLQRGSVKAKRLPTPRRLSHQILPPWASTKRRDT